MKNKLTSLCLSIIFSLSCLTGQTVAMEDREEESIISDEVIIEKNLGELHCCKHNDGEQLTVPENKEKADIKRVINLYETKDALDGLKKLVDNKVSTGTETLYSKSNCKELRDCNFRLDQPAKVTTESQSKMSEKGKKIKNSKYKNKRNKKFSKFDDASTDSSSTDSNSSFEEDSNKKGDAIVIINVQKGSDTYCEVVVKRSVLAYFDILPNQNNKFDSKSEIEQTIKNIDDEYTKLLSNQKQLSVNQTVSWQNHIYEQFEKVKEQLSQDAKDSLDKLKKIKVSSYNKTTVCKNWKDLKEKLLSVENDEDKNNETIDENKLNELKDLVVQELENSLKNKKVYAIYY